MIMKSLSPYEQNVVAPLFKNFAEKGIDRVRRNFWDFVPALVCAYLVMAGGDKMYHDEQLTHRS